MASRRPRERVTLTVAGSNHILPASSPYDAHAGGRLVGDLRIQVFGALFGLATVHHELQFILEQQRTGPFATYMDRWSVIKPTVGWSSEVGITLHLLDLLLGALLLVLPYRRALLILVGLSFLLANLVSPERTASHNSLMVAASAALLILGSAELIENAVCQRWRRARTDWYGWTITGLTWLCALTYAFAMLHKLNWTFLSLADSTAPPFAFVFVEPLGISRETSLVVFGYAAIYGTLAIEAALPFLLMWRPTRMFGCFLGVSFHLAMMARGIMDFPTLILGFYPLFMTVDEARELLSRFATRPSPLRLATTVVVAAIGALIISRSAYVHDLYANPVDLEPVLMWVHSALLYATFFWFAYVLATVGAILLHRGSARSGYGPVAA